MDDSTAFHSVRDYKVDEDKEIVNVGDFVSVFGGVKVAKGEQKNVFMNAFKIIKLNQSGTRVLILWGKFCTDLAEIWSWVTFILRQNHISLAFSRTVMDSPDLIFVA